jgi:hypothetical protein
MTSLMALIASDFNRLHPDRCDDQGGFTVQMAIIWGLFWGYWGFLTVRRSSSKGLMQEMSHSREYHHNP